jgi:hypothetical protein
LLKALELERELFDIAALTVLLWIVIYRCSLDTTEEREGNLLTIYDIPSFCDIEGKNAIKAIVVPRVPEEKKIFCWINREFDIIVCESIVGNGCY